MSITQKIAQAISRWLTHEPELPLHDSPMFDFNRLSYELRPADILLVEGRSRVSNVIKMITQSPWTHAMIYIGRFYDIQDENLRQVVANNYDGSPNEQLIIEALLGEGTVIHPLSKYKSAHLRICRAKGLSPLDAHKVISFAIQSLGKTYDIRQLLDLARFMFPWGILPRRWRSSLFEHNAGDPTRTVCSTMLAEAFHTVRFPLLPFAKKTEQGQFHLYQMNPRLFTPKDFDYSPYFEIIKYPFFGVDDVAIYKHLPWTEQEMYCNDINECYPVASSTSGAISEGVEE